MLAYSLSFTAASFVQTSPYIHALFPAKLYARTNSGNFSSAIAQEPATKGASQC